LIPTKGKNKKEEILKLINKTKYKQCIASREISFRMIILPGAFKLSPFGGVGGGLICFQE
jgi:hypothetical protein